MIWEQLQENVFFAVIPELEAIAIAESLLFGGEKEELCKQFFDEGKIVQWKKKYRFLFETVDAVKNIEPYGLIENICNMDLEHFTLENFKKEVMEVPAAERLDDQLGWGKVQRASLSDIENALSSEQKFMEFYDRIEEECPNYLGVYAFFNEQDRYAEEFISLVSDVMQEDILSELKRYSPKIEHIKNKIKQGLEVSDPLSVSESFMGKTFYNRGPYEIFVFIASVYIPYRCVRFFTPDDRFEEAKRKQQVMVISLQDEKKTMEDNVIALKAIGDMTRYQILSILAKQGSIHGRELCKLVNVAPSTLSHHMELLRECGMITEEQVRTSKYYGINKNRVSDLIKDLSRDWNC